MFGKFEKGRNSHFCDPPGPIRSHFLMAIPGDTWTCGHCGRLWFRQYADRHSMHETWRSQEDLETSAVAFFDKRWHDHLEARRGGDS